MTMSNKFAQRSYIVFGIIFLLFSGIFSTASISTGVFPIGQVWLFVLLTFILNLRKMTNDQN